ncbi:hypothetical protein Tsubulata_018648 [Turnera subulata]|uniref:Uncharacterized protein n=1 Tax=Turnera subulata TaxID=218843 RepID=A0A9Q0F7Q4_9ROSI|nr:hypothetical protein Tsubulata_018648 [Turnera subulata]
MDNGSDATVSKVREVSVFEVSDLSLVSRGIPAHELQMLMSNETKNKPYADDVIALGESQHIVVEQDTTKAAEEPITKRVIGVLGEGLLLEKKNGRSVRIQAWGKLKKRQTRRVTRKHSKKKGGNLGQWKRFRKKMRMTRKLVLCKCKKLGTRKMKRGMEVGKSMRKEMRRRETSSAMQVFCGKGGYDSQNFKTRGKWWSLQVANQCVSLREKWGKNASLGVTNECIEARRKWRQSNRCFTTFDPGGFGGIFVAINPKGIRRYKIHSAPHLTRSQFARARKALRENGLIYGVFQVTNRYYTMGPNDIYEVDGKPMYTGKGIGKSYIMLSSYMVIRVVGMGTGSFRTMMAPHATKFGLTKLRGIMSRNC